MNYLSAENLTHSFNERYLFRDLNLGLTAGDKVALIAPNGSGKSTILKILAGRLAPESGKFSLREGLRVGYLDQDPELQNHLSINELLNTSHTEVLTVIRAYEAAVEAQAVDYNETTAKAFEKAATLMDSMQAWDYERRLKEVLSRFGITDLELKIGSLSGGQRKRLALALTLLDTPELLILDEPTNHLDIDMIEWLEKYLSQANLTLLMVTHDRYFLDRICSHILELADGRLYKHEGNYADFLLNKAERENIEKVENHKLQQVYKQELMWMRKSPKARTTKSKARIEQFYNTEEKANQKKDDSSLKLDVTTRRMGGKVLEIKNLSKSYGSLVILEKFEYTFRKGERLGIVGKNGVGKSTFLNLITGKETPDKGVIETGETIVFGYYHQSGMQLKQDKRVIEVMKDIAEVVTTSDGSTLSASQFLQHFMFTGEMQYTPVSKLSGGEKRRLYLMTVLMQNPNFLILDEPTNDLDIVTLNRLEDFLLQYGGCLIVVSHDRYFMDKLADHLFIFEGNGSIRDFNGSYSEYRDEVQAAEAAVSKKKEPEPVKEVPKAQTQKKKMSFKETQEFERLEKEIKELEEEKSGLILAMESSGSDYTTVQKQTQRMQELTTLLDSKTFRWLELAEYLN